MKKTKLFLFSGLLFLISPSILANNTVPKYVHKNIEINKYLDIETSSGSVLNGTVDNIFSIPLLGGIMTEEEYLKYAKNRLLVDSILTNTTLFTTGTASKGEKVLYVTFALDNIKEFGKVWFELNSEKYKDYKKIWIPNIINGKNSENTGVIYLYGKMLRASNIVNFFNNIDYKNMPDLLTVNNEDYSDAEKLSSYVKSYMYDTKLIYNNIVSIFFEKITKDGDPYSARFSASEENKREKLLNIYKYDSRGNLIKYDLIK